MRNEIGRINKGQTCIVDSQKAFDTLDHEILTIKLEKYCFRGNFLEMTRKYLSTGIILFVETEIIQLNSVVKMAFPRAVY